MIALQELFLCFGLEVGWDWTWVWGWFYLFDCLERLYQSCVKGKSMSGFLLRIVLFVNGGLNFYYK